VPWNDFKKAIKAVQAAYDAEPFVQDTYDLAVMKLSQLAKNVEPRLGE